MGTRWLRSTRQVLSWQAWTRVSECLSRTVSNVKSASHYTRPSGGNVETYHLILRYNNQPCNSYPSDLFFLYVLFSVSFSFLPFLFERFRFESLYTKSSISLLARCSMLMSKLILEPRIACRPQPLCLLLASNIQVQGDGTLKSLTSASVCSSTRRCPATKQCLTEFCLAAQSPGN